MGATAQVVVETPPGPVNEETLACGDNGMPVPDAFKPCATDGDCTIMFTALDCCGTPAAVGVAVDQTASFHAYEDRCNANVDQLCGCDPGPARTDDGSRTMTAPSITVRCDEGTCSTFVK